MKNLTIKKVALGLVLAGYAASGAFAATSATTAKTIIGNAPTIKSTATTPTAGKYSFVVKRGGTDISTLSGDAKKARVGDTVEVTFTYNDSDGDDAEPNWLTGLSAPKTGNELVFAIAGGSAIAATDITATHAAADGTSAKYVFTIPSDAKNKGLTINLTPMSEFGDPWKGTNINGNLFAVTNGDGTTPELCDTNPTACIIDETEGLIVRILKGSDIYGSSDATEQTAAAAFTPKIGDVFVYQVWDTLAVAGSEDITTTYKGQWSYTGNNSNALGGQSAAASVNPTTPAIGATYTIGVNSTDVLSTGNSYDAGAQGFTLKVDVSK